MIKPVHPKGNQPWIFIGRTDAKAEAPILWPPDVKNQLIGKDPDAGKDWRWEKKGMTEDEMVGWHHQLKGHESEQIPGYSARQESLACCSPWGCKESDSTYWINNNDTRHLHPPECQPQDLNILPALALPPVCSCRTFLLTEKGLLCIYRHCWGRQSCLPIN